MRDDGVKSLLEDPRAAARRSLAELVEQERRRAQFYIDLIRTTEPTASPDRIAAVLLDRWTTVAKVEGGMTGVLGWLGIPLNLLLFTYCQIGVTVGIAEAYGVQLRGEAGEEALVEILGRVHGVPDVLRAGPRVLGALAKALALKYGLGTLGRMVPLVAAPVSARMNQRELRRVGEAAMQRFGNVVLLP